ncbi:hypothetical protein FEI13_16370 [Halomonas urmiana]|uniref:Glycosyltransferase family 4 protein n=1 Tax=Halomonas urmiana TaxID=490901 RepID=A0A5R8MEV1_9GAMM|nr:glycosyltransferase [Halomonas urmiana]TLF47249.1 hypothetical protein FEI13_16370 [Halomonas urmiana]
MEKSIKKFKKFARREISSVSVRFDRALGRSIVKSSRRPQELGAACLTPNKILSYYFTNVKSGRYVLKIEHDDSYVYERKESLVAEIKVSNNKITEFYARKMGLLLSDNNCAFSYLGEGKKDGSRIVQEVTFTVPHDQRWVKIQLSSPYDRVVNINGILFREDVDTEGLKSWAAREAISLIGRNAELPEAAFILYADIDMNVVDGSSIWLSSMASILCGLGKCIIISKESIINDIVMSNVEYRHNLIVVSPDELENRGGNLSVEAAIELIRALDANLPSIRNVVVRGLYAATRLHDTRQFKYRSLVYLTDFYSIVDGSAYVSEVQEKSVNVCVAQAGALLVQTSKIKEKIEEISHSKFAYLDTPPTVPDGLPVVSEKQIQDQSVIKIGYAGKINPDWGVEELLDWGKYLKSKGKAVEIHIVANKISNGGIDGIEIDFSEKIHAKFSEPNIYHYADYNREQAIRMMSSMDFVWCWRPPKLEESTLELSTKLIEMCAIGAKSICYPSDINRSLLGESYPFYARDKKELSSLINEDWKGLPQSIREKVNSEHSISIVRERLSELITPSINQVSPQKVCVSGHDYKFIDPFLSYLKKNGHHVVRDEWEWGSEKNLALTKSYQEWADIIFCEWGLANAVWHSNNPILGKKLYIRVHLQEVNERARKFGHKIDINNVDKVIFVSDQVKERAKELFGWPDEKLTTIPNFVLSDEYLLKEAYDSQSINLGMVGIIPQRKRFDRAVDTLYELKKKGYNANLYIKGPRPEELDFMKAESRKPELDYYREQYKRIDEDPLLAGSVIFEPWGNDVAAWYKKIDHILSPSDFESFHYALADGVLSGCNPIVWSWDEAEFLYTSDWIVKGASDAADRIVDYVNLTVSDKRKRMESNRELVANKYGYKIVFDRLSSEIGV